jgi:hypothetical protein
VTTGCAPVVVQPQPTPQPVIQVVQANQVAQTVVQQTAASVEAETSLHTEAVQNELAATTFASQSIEHFAGPPGPPGPVGPTGPSSGTGDLHYRFIQSIPSATWHIGHGLGKYPSVSAVDSSGASVIGGIDHLDAYNCVITFTAAFSGEAYCN